MHFFRDELAARLSFMFCPVGCIFIVCCGFKYCEQGRENWLLFFSFVYGLGIRVRLCVSKTDLTTSPTPPSASPPRPTPFVYY